MLDAAIGVSVMAKIHINPANKGDLHKALEIPAKQHIPLERLESAKNSGNAHMRQMANFAINARGFKHSK